ncbi:MAG: DUF4166 domain-containing protein [Azospirillum brasilense]|nr:MAG: DUF4166 domain-containing protein [Azospirillum brasilense]
MTQPIFQSVFAEQWEALPPVMKLHYALRTGTGDQVMAKGALDIRACRMVRMLARTTGMLTPYEGTAVPVDVRFHTGADAKQFCLDRQFHYPGGKPARFHSRMCPVGGDEVIEWMRYGFGWKCAFAWEGDRVTLRHRGYVWKLFGLHLPVPLHWLLGKGYAEERPLTDTRFAMWTHTIHPLFGETFRYGGEFELSGGPCAAS